MPVKSGGMDNINIKTIKMLSKQVINILMHKWNLSTATAVWSEDLKRADIIPAYKSKYKNCVKLCLNILTACFSIHFTEGASRKLFSGQKNNLGC